MKKGFTLIEVMITAVIMGFLIMGIVRFSRDFLSSYDFSFQETRAISEAQQSINIMERKSDKSQGKQGIQETQSKRP